jgi:hypothetical protein
LHPVSQSHRQVAPRSKKVALVYPNRRVAVLIGMKRHLLSKKTLVFTALVSSITLAGQGCASRDSYIYNPPASELPADVPSFTVRASTPTAFASPAFKAFAYQVAWRAPYDASIGVPFLPDEGYYPPYGLQFGEAAASRSKHSFEEPTNNPLIAGDSASLGLPVYLSGFGEAATGFLYVLAIPSGGLEIDAANAWMQKRGGSTSHVFAYLDTPAPAGSPWTKVYGGPLVKGYNLLRVRDYTAEEAALPMCSSLTKEQKIDPIVRCRGYSRHLEPAPNGFEDEIALEFGKDERIITTDKFRFLFESD